MDERTYQGDFEERYQAAFGGLQVQVETACADAGSEWPAQLAAGVRAALDFALADPDAARVLAIESMTVAGPGRNRYVRLIEHFAALLRVTAPAERRQPVSTEQGLIAGMAATVAEQLRAGGPEALRDLAPELVELVLTPYLGGEEARRWAQRRP